METKIEQVIAIQKKMIFGTPQYKLDEYKKQMEAVMETMTGAEIKELFEAFHWPQQFKIYYKKKYIEKFTEK